MENTIKNKNCILIVDDDFINRELLKNIFSAQYAFREATNGREGLEQIKQHLDKLCAIILDVQMPEMTGLEVLEIISRQGITEQVPVFLITAQDDHALVTTAYGMGVVDVISKPVIPVVIQKRVKTVIELFSAREILSATVRGQELQLQENVKVMDQLHLGTIEALAAAIEFRDVESGEHTNRIYSITKYILSATSFGQGLSQEDIENIARGSIMHDVGKITISDVILNKPGKLTKEEFEVMKQHTTKGALLLEQIWKIQLHDSYRYAWDIALHHHERWDGRGYPDGLKGSEISVAAQVVSIADVYDALVSPRVYKKAFSAHQAVEMIKNGECGCFNPKLVECFLEAEPVIRKWYTAQPLQQSPAVAVGEASGLSGQPESNSVLDVLLLTTAVQTAYDMIISVNLTRNSYYMIDYDRFGTHCADYGGVFDDLIDQGAASIPLSHRQEFRDTFCRESLLRAFREGKKSVRLEHPQYGDDGTLHWVATKVLFMEDGRTGDILQITLSQYLDEEYAQREQARKVLADALHLAEQANNAKYDFLSRMSHDIRTPLNAIIGMSTIIAANLENREKIQDCLVKIGASSKYLLGIVNDVLDYSKIENGSMALHPEDFNLQDLISDIIGDAAEQARAKQQTVTLSVGDHVGDSYVGDEFRIRQILVNLLDNACRYTPAGGEISMHVDATRHSGLCDLLTFSVADNGMGIQPEFIEHLFEPFAQESSGSAERIGLGLPIARNLAHLMNGDLGVVSQPGKGSTFTLELPLERGSLAACPEIIDPQLNVLVVDDDTDVCEQAALLLENMGIEATTAGSGMEAITLVSARVGTEDAFDVAIIDWKMPQMDGVETVRHIRRVAGRDVLVVVMSAYDWTDIEQEAREAGVDLFLAKPINEANLRTAIASSEKLRRNLQDVRFSGEKVLIAEDNTFNAEVAKAILEMKGLTVDITADGRECYERFLASQPGEYCAILMDILMPVMDGHEAARAIRASHHPNAHSVPIFAVTANAFHNDILKAKLAGMDGHISKPVNFDELARLLQSAVKRRTEPSGGAADYGALEDAGIHMESLLKRLMGNDSLIRTLIETFTRDETFAQLQDAFRREDPALAETAGSSLKDMCGNLSMAELYSQFSRLVYLLRAGELPKARDLLDKLAPAHSVAVTQMQRWLDETAE